MFWVSRGPVMIWRLVQIVTMPSSYERAEIPTEEVVTGL